MKSGWWHKRLVFWCPGCKEEHMINSTWDISGVPDNVTIKPSIFVDRGRPERQCHSYVRNGKIEFLADCHHELKGTTVDLPHLEDHMKTTKFIFLTEEESVRVSDG